jgi:hypothetical protein
VIIVVIDSANAGDRARSSKLVQAATRTDSKGLARHNVGLPLPAISQVTAVDDQFGTHRVEGTGRAIRFNDCGRGRWCGS